MNFACEATLMSRPVYSNISLILFVLLLSPHAFGLPEDSVSYKLTAAQKSESLNSLKLPERTHFKTYLDRNGEKHHLLRVRRFRGKDSVVIEPKFKDDGIWEFHCVLKNERGNNYTGKHRSKADIQRSGDSKVGSLNPRVGRPNRFRIEESGRYRFPMLFLLRKDGVENTKGAKETIKRVLFHGKSVQSTPAFIGRTGDILTSVAAFSKSYGENSDKLKGRDRAKALLSRLSMDPKIADKKNSEVAIALLDQLSAEGKLEKLRLTPELVGGFAADITRMLVDPKDKDDVIDAAGWITAALRLAQMAWKTFFVDKKHYRVLPAYMTICNEHPLCSIVMAEEFYWGKETSADKPGLQRTIYAITPLNEDFPEPRFAFHSESSEAPLPVMRVSAKDSARVQIPLCFGLDENDKCFETQLGEKAENLDKLKNTLNILSERFVPEKWDASIIDAGGRSLSSSADYSVSTGSLILSAPAGLEPPYKVKFSGSTSDGAIQTSTLLVQKKFKSNSWLFATEPALRIQGDRSSPILADAPGSQWIIADPGEKTFSTRAELTLANGQKIKLGGPKSSSGHLSNREKKGEEIHLEIPDSSHLVPGTATLSFFHGDAKIYTQEFRVLPHTRPLVKFSPGTKLAWIEGSQWGEVSEVFFEKIGLSQKRGDGFFEFPDELSSVKSGTVTFLGARLPADIQVYDPALTAEISFLFPRSQLCSGRDGSGGLLTFGPHTAPTKPQEVSISGALGEALGSQGRFVEFMIGNEKAITERSDYEGPGQTLVKLVPQKPGRLSYRYGELRNGERIWTAWKKTPINFTNVFDSLSWGFSEKQGARYFIYYPESRDPRLSSFLSAAIGKSEETLGPVLPGREFDFRLVPKTIGDKTARTGEKNGYQSFELKTRFGKARLDTRPQYVSL